MADDVLSPDSQDALATQPLDVLAGDVLQGPWGSEPRPTPEDRQRELRRILGTPTWQQPTPPPPLPIGPQGPTPKQGQVIPPQNLKQQMARGNEEALQLGAELTGVMDVRRALSGELPWHEALGGIALGMIPGGAELKTAKGAGAVMERLAATAPEWLNPLTHMPIKGPAFKRAMDAANKYIASLPKGAGPLDLSNVAAVNVPQLALARYVPPRGVSERVQSALQNAEVIAGVRQSIEDGMRLGAHLWYHTEPIRAAFEKEFGPDRWQRPFKLFMDMQAAASPKSDVSTQIRNGSWMYAHAINGAPLPPKGPEIYPYGHLAQNKHRENFADVLRRGWDVIKNPKPPSFSENLQGNLLPGTMDTHAFRNVGMRTRDPRFLETSISEIIPKTREITPDSYAARFGEIKIGKKGERIVTYRPQKLVAEGRLSIDEALEIPPFWASKPNDNEYAAVEQLYARIGAEYGLAPAEAQAAAWAGAGKLTGLGTEADRTFPELLNQRIMYTAHIRNEHPQQVLSDMIRGRKPLLGLGGLGITTPIILDELGEPQDN